MFSIVFSNVNQMCFVSSLSPFDVFFQLPKLQYRSPKMICTSIVFYYLHRVFKDTSRDIFPLLNPGSRKKKKSQCVIIAVWLRIKSRARLINLSHITQLLCTQYPGKREFKKCIVQAIVLPNSVFVLVFFKILTGITF